MIAECSAAIRGAAVAAGAVTALECITTLGKVTSLPAPGFEAILVFTSGPTMPGCVSSLESTAEDYNTVA